MEDKLKLQSRANERYQYQFFEEIKELEQKKSEEALRMVQKKHDLRRYQNETDEARRPQKEWAGLAAFYLFESCRSSVVDFDKEMTSESLRKRPEWPE